MANRCEICGKILNYHDILDLVRGCHGCLNKEEIEVEKFLNGNPNN